VFLLKVTLFWVQNSIKMKKNQKENILFQYSFLMPKKTKIQGKK
jgi:hypothetical protein